MAIQYLLHQIGCRITRLKRQCHHSPPGGLYLFAPGNEVAPVRTLHQKIWQHLSNQFPGRILIKESNGIHSLK